MGSPDAFLAALLTTKGGAVQSVILNRFEEANRLGREVKVNGETQPLRLIPGIRRPARRRIAFQEPDGGAFPSLNPGRHFARVRCASWARRRTNCCTTLARMIRWRSRRTRIG